ncbi:PRFB1 [Symbiodinium natans]|uniref:PRFB1 protein n=1 Tax=Symbiodinium natans TaxID=878477 RepID=A0A812P9M3_9DINO|nr:PRFB1 [Symbiodinium natans]
MEQQVLHPPTHPSSHPPHPPPATQPASQTASYPRTKEQVVPVLPDDAASAVDIDAKDLTWDTFRSGGKGGQNVNKLETGVRVTHAPTGIAVRCTEERSQLSNRNKALLQLKAKLMLIKEQQRVQELREIRGDLVSAQWGAQVRNYVLQPYTMVKDVRSGHERGDADRVLDGDLDSHVDALLRMETKTKS